ncbi:MAG TPA: lipocalin family protein [Spirochaetales bacterium]|nr:lipocalin family protein [Spirochaetales bacterium]
MKVASLLSGFVLTTLLASCATTPAGMGPLEVVPEVDPVRYAGRWYEIARFQHGFEKSIVGATAEYTLWDDGTIGVVNSGFKKTLDGRYTSVKAVARVPDTAAPGRLKVKFFGLFESDYLIFGLDAENYSWALVGNDSRDYLWFLSRTPEVDSQTLEMMKNIALGQGYDLSGLYLVPQKARED